MEKEKPLIGAVRWDAWFPGNNSTRNGGPRNVGQQVSDTLSQVKFHFRVPYFAKLEDDDITVTYPMPTQELFDEEMQYAAEAGIDYFAYCMYKDGNEMAYARKFHMQSPLRNTVKYCAILASGDYNILSNLDELTYLFKQDYYVKVCNGRPLVYIYNYTKDTTEADIAAIKASCSAANIPVPYFAGMFWWNYFDINSPLFDAVSGYGAGGTNGQSFKSLAQIVEGRWDNTVANYKKLIPLVTTGWDPRPRNEHLVDWCENPPHSWVQTPTIAEIDTHLTNAISFIKENSQACEANTLLIYAWNENDEGGWLVPTGKVSENGTLIRDKNGNLIPDTSRIEAMRKIIYNN